MQALDLAHEHLAAVRAKLTELKALERRIAAFVARCHASCAGGPGPDCVILADLSKGGRGTKTAKQGSRSNRLPRSGRVAGRA